MNWQDWYKANPFKAWPVRIFWEISDYGGSLGRIVTVFFALAFVFAIAYRLWPEFIIFNNQSGIRDFQSFWHALYFSVVTMTTLGFGDIAANPNSWLGQTLLMVQVILGYILLGALITKLAILFTSEGPSIIYPFVQHSPTVYISDKLRKN